MLPPGLSPLARTPNDSFVTAESPSSASADLYAPHIDCVFSLTPSPPLRSREQITHLEAENRRLQAAHGANARVAEIENRLDDSEKLNERLQQELTGLSRRLAEAEAVRGAAAKNDADVKAATVRTDELTKRVRQLEAENKQYLADIDGLVRQATSMKVRFYFVPFFRYLIACL